ncbi:hypothetical protein ACFY5D_18550 [Paeniglutamicibacter sp. NPDC012692]|uniref:hypothetical protein n=1 Tax=Paeniglutamicibacter sp. NPDC012692 TaxID=3364388 RepID=UPI0036A9A6F6
MKKTALWAVPLAAALALTACSAPKEPTPQSQPAVEQSPSATQTPAATDAAAEPSSSAAGTPEAIGKQLTADQVYAVVSELKDDEATAGAQLLKDAELKAGASQIEQFVAGMKVKPEVCGAFAAGGMAEALESVNMASLVVPATASAASTSVSIASYASEAEVRALAAKQKKSFEECATFSLEIQGREASATLKDTKATTDAATTLASLGTVKLDGQTMKTLSVYGMDGNNTVAVTLTAPKDVDAAVKKAEKTINAALKRIADQ